MTKAKVTLDDLRFAAEWLQSYDAEGDEWDRERRDRVVAFIEDEIASRMDRIVCSGIRKIDKARAECGLPPLQGDRRSEATRRIQEAYKSSGG